MTMIDFFSLSAEARCCSLHAQRHNSGDCPELQGLQAQQETDPERSSHDWETREAAENRAGEEAPAETPGDQWMISVIK